MHLNHSLHPVTFALALTLLLSAGCARLPMDGEFKGGIKVDPIAAVTRNSPLACAATGDRIAFVDGGLRLSVAGRVNTVLLTEDLPHHLSWSIDGKRLAAAFTAPGVDVLRLFTADGNAAGTRAFPGRIMAIGWDPAGDVLVATVELKSYSFGGNLRQNLYRWDGKAEPRTTLLTDTTPRRGVMASWGELLPRLLSGAFAPSGDAIVFSRLRDPPAFDPYVQLVLRYLDVDSEQEIGRFSITASASQFAADGNLLVYGNGKDKTIMVDPWSEQQLQSFPVPGVTLAVSSSGKMVFVDGHVFREGKEILLLPKDSAACFTSTGMIIRYGSNLFRVRGLPPEGGEKISADPAQRLKLRKWRAEGLITVQEYRQAMERMQP